MASTTIVPFAKLPPCATLCGPLYDVNGACVPPAAASADEVTYEKCFCSDARLAPFSSTTAGVCDSACAANPSDYGSITSWYKSLCGSVRTLAPGGTTSPSSSSTGVPSSSGSKSGGDGGSWLSSHWKWVIFIVVMVVGIAGIWIGAAMWRRHYLRKKDRQYSLGKNLARRTGSGQNPYSGPSPARSASILRGHRQDELMPSSAGTNPLIEKPPQTKKRCAGTFSCCWRRRSTRSRRTISSFSGPMKLVSSHGNDASEITHFVDTTRTQ